MKLSFFKIEMIKDGIIYFQPGAIQLQVRKKVIALDQYLSFKIKENGFIDNVLQDIKMAVFEGYEIEPRKKFKESLINILAHEDFKNKIYEEFYDEKNKI